MYVVMNKYNNVFYKREYVTNGSIWTLNIDDAKKFETEGAAFNHMYVNDISKKDILVVAI